MSERSVYAVGAADGPQKIGLATDPSGRLKHVQCGSPVALAVGFSLPLPADRALKVERYAHWLLREHRLEGEWFSVTPRKAKEAIIAAARAIEEGAQQSRKTLGRKKRWAEDMQARFPEGTFERIAAVLEDSEDRTDFVREAVERELKRRERKQQN